MIGMNVGRLIIIFAALFKSLPISRVIIYYESLILMLEGFLPIDKDIDRANIVLAFR